MLCLDFCAFRYSDVRYSVIHCTPIFDLFGPFLSKLGKCFNQFGCGITDTGDKIGSDFCLKKEDFVHMYVFDSIFSLK